MGVSLIIPAAGSGRRFASTVPKQLLPLAGRAVLLRSLDAFAGLADEAVLAVSDGIADEVRALIAGFAGFPVRLVAGGRERQDSVRAALGACTGDLVLVHDAVRPLVPRACIQACISAIREHGAALVALPCAHTVKRGSDAGLVAATVARADLWLAQTPQGFRRELGVAAFARAAAEGWRCTDDAEVLERAGQPVALVPGDACNLKITTPDDWEVAEALLASPAGGGAPPAARPGACLPPPQRA